MLAGEALLGDQVTLYPGDCLAVLPDLPECSFDSCVCDPPYHLTSIVKRFGKTDAAPAKSNGATGVYARAAGGFMGHKWDSDIAFRPATWRAVYRVLKPGAYVVAFGGTRSAHRLACAIEDAGFIIHPFLAWLFGQGFPKATRITASGLSDLDRATEGWDGWRYGTQSMKPAIEPIYVGQRPFDDGLTGTENVMRWGVGALNIDGCRVGEESITTRINTAIQGNNYARGDGRGLTQECNEHVGRWPANVVHDGSDEVVAGFPDAPGQQRYVGPEHGDRLSRGIYGDFGARPPNEPRNDSGSAARFFFSPKADADDRLGSGHPTVKPIDLIRWLVRLVTPPGGLCLDPFAGSGTMGEAAFREGMRAVLIEREETYCADIRRRMGLVMSGQGERKRATARAKAERRPIDPGPLFGGTG